MPLGQTSSSRHIDQARFADQREEKVLLAEVERIAI